MKTLTFPEVTGKNLHRKKHKFPDDFPAKYNVILLAFYRHQQMDINTWLPFLTQLENKYKDLEYIELPVIYKMGAFRQIMLNEGMRAGIPDPKARAKTITLYLDKPRFLEQLGINSEDEIQILLVADNGKVFWQESGVYSSEKGSGLNAILLKETQFEIAQAAV